MTIIYLILSFLLLLTSNLSAKDNQGKIIEEVDSLLELSKDSKYNVNIESAIEYAYHALSMSEEVNYSRGKAKSYLNLGQTLFYLGSYEKSLEYLSLAEKEPYVSGDPVMLFEVSRVRGQIYTYLNLYKQSIREFQKCLAFAEDITPKQNSDYCFSLTYENLSVVYEYLDSADSVLYFMNKNRQVLESMDESFAYRNMVNLYTSFGNIYSIEGEFGLAKEFFDNALNLTEKYQYPYQSRTYIFLGDMEVRKENPDSAMFYYNKALSNLETTKIKGEYSLVYGQIGELFRQTGNIDSARIYNEKQNSVDIELSTERQNSVEHALQIFIDEERKNSAKKRNIELTIISISSLVLIVLIIVVWRKSRKRLLQKKEEEAKKLQSQLHNTLKEIEVKEEKTKVLEQKINESFNELIELAKNNDTTFLKRFQEIYPEPSQRLLQKHPNLSNSELILSAMIFLNFTSKEIATYTFVEHRSVQTKKSRLRKKLDLPAGANLEQYFASFSK